MNNDDAQRPQDKTQRMDRAASSQSDAQAKRESDGHTADAADALVPEAAFAPKTEPDSDEPPAPATELPVIDEADGAVKAALSQPKKRRRWQVVVAVVIALVVLCGIVYGGGVYYYSSHFLPNTELSGRDVSGMAQDEVASMMSGSIDGYALKVTGDGFNMRIPGDNIDLVYDGAAYAQAAMAQVEKWSWPLELGKQHTYDVQSTLSYDSGKLGKLIDGTLDTVNEDVTNSTDATVSYDADKEKFVVVSETYGTKIDRSLVLAAIDSAIESQKTSLVLDENVRDQPSVTRDDTRLTDAAAAANVYRKCSIPLTVDGKKVYTVGIATIQKWISISKDFEVSISSSAAKSWAQGEFSDSFDTVGNKRTYTLKVGKKSKKVTVKGGTYGWVVDGASLAKKLVSQVKKTNNSSLEIPMSSEAAQWNPDGADWTRYIDIDLTTQHAYLIDASGKVLWESDIVSGLPKDGRSTPTGVYTITSSMGRNQTLIGSDEDGDGEPDYKTPVSYWMPFVGNSVALHDADWRSSFGGKIYKTNGSHGCVNLPVSKAKKLYSLVHVGDVVVCHK